MKIDRIFSETLSALQRNARISNKELAAEMHLAPSSCLDRVRRLEKAGVIRGYHAELDLQALGLGLEAIIAVRLSSHSREVLSEFYDYAASLDRVLRVYYMAGREDFLIHVAAHDTTELRDLILEEITKRDHIEHIETSLVYGSQRSVLQI